MKYFILIPLVLALGGCEIIGPKVGPTLAKGVNRYCAQPLNVRLALRQQVNELIDPNHVQVDCAADANP